MKDKIEIGDTVEVASCSSMYEACERMARFLGSTGFVEGKYPSSMVFTVVNIGIHDPGGWDVYLLSNESGEFLFDNNRGSIKVINKAKLTRTEYVKVDDSIFDLKAEFEAGELYVKHKNNGKYVKINSESWLVSAKNNGNVYRKVEREVTWQDELERLYPVNAINGHVSFNRLITDAEFIELCHKVHHLTK